LQYFNIKQTLKTVKSVVQVAFVNSAVILQEYFYTSSAVAEMGDRGHNIDMGRK